MEYFPEWMKCCSRVANTNENEKDVSLGATCIKDNKSLDKNNIHIQLNQENYEESKSSFTFHQNEDIKNSVIQKNEKLLNNPCRMGTIPNHRLSRNSNFSAFSQVTFSNMKVKDFTQSASVVDTELVNKFELRLNGELFWNKELVVDCLGLQLGKRRKREGMTIFGTSNTDKKVGDYKNDFVINIKNGEYNKTTTPIFFIEFDKGDEHFFIGRISKAIKIFHLLDYDFFLDLNHEAFFYLGKIKIAVLIHSIFNCEDKSKVQIRIKNNKDYTQYTFEEDDLPISIGRSNSKINIKNNSISKHHAIIDYSIDYKKFYIKDTGSTNGTFYLLKYKSRLKILGEMRFKILETKFSVCEIE